MANEMKVLFSVNDYDRDGDIAEAGLFLHLGDNIRLRFEDTQDLADFANRILGMLPEIRENYPEVTPE